jgi:hypothetical protein
MEGRASEDRTAAGPADVAQQRLAAVAAERGRAMHAGMTYGVCVNDACPDPAIVPGGGARTMIGALQGMAYRALPALQCAGCDMELFDAEYVLGSGA